MNVNLDRISKLNLSDYETKVVMSSLNCLDSVDCTDAVELENLYALREIQKKCQFKKNLVEAEYVTQQLLMCKKLDALYTEETRKCCEEIQKIMKNEPVEQKTGPKLKKEEKEPTLKD